MAKNIYQDRNEKYFKIRVKFFINKRTNQITMAVQRKKSEEFINYLPKIKQVNFLDLRMRKRNDKK